MKISKTVEKIHGKEITKFFVEGVHVATCKKYKEWFCTVDREGRPSNIRDRMKWAKETIWNSEALVQLLGEGVRTERGFSRNPVANSKRIFFDIYPDLSWGYSGAILTPAKIKKAFKEFNALSI